MILGGCVFLMSEVPLYLLQILVGSSVEDSAVVQRYLAHKEHTPRRTLQ